MRSKVLVDILDAVADQCERRKAFALRTMGGDALALELHAADEARRAKFVEFVGEFAAP